MPVSVDGKSGDLLLTTADGAQVRQVRPKVYQQIGDKRVAIAAGYELLDRSRASFTLASYDHRQPLIIDPILAYQVYLGGSNLDYVSAIAHNEDGHTFVTGNTTSTDFPDVHGIQPSSPRNNNAFVTHLAGIEIVSSTYLGGSGEDSGMGIAVDDTGIYVTGQTNSPDFPHQMSKTSAQNSDAFVTKIALDGGSILYTTILSGAGFTNASGIAVNPATHNVYISGSTSASNFPNIYPLNSGWHQLRYGGGPMDAFAVELDSAGNIYRSNLLGGNDIDVAQAIAVDNDGNPWVTGLTCSPDFINQYSPAQSKAPGCVGFVASWTNDFALLRFSRFWEQGTAVTADRFGNGYVAGVADGTYAGIGGTKQGSPLVTKFNQRGDLMNYRSLTGANGWSTASSIALNSLGEVYLGGYTLATSFPGLPPLPAGSITGILAILSSDFKDVRYTGMFGHQVKGITVLDFLPRRIYPLAYLAANVSGPHGDDAYVAQLVDDPTPYQQFEGKLLEDSRGDRSFIVAGQRKLVPDENTRNALGLGSFPLVSIDSVGAIPDAGSYPPLQPGKTLRDPANNRVYQLSEGVLHWIPDGATFEKMGLSWDNVVTLPTETLNRIPEGLKLPAL